MNNMEDKGKLESNKESIGSKKKNNAVDQAMVSQSMGRINNSSEADLE